MTQSPFTAAREARNIDDAVASLRDSGSRVTGARRILLEALFASDAPASVEQLVSAIGDRTPSDLASVYRNLERFEELGLVRHVHLGHGPGLYAIAGGPEREYLVCERCGKVTSLEPTELDPIRAQIHKRFGHRARFSHFPIAGLCATCASELKE